MNAQIRIFWDEVSLSRRTSDDGGTEVVFESLERGLLNTGESLGSRSVSHSWVLLPREEDLLLSFSGGEFLFLGGRNQKDHPVSPEKPF